MVVGDLRCIGAGNYGTVFREIQDHAQVKAMGGIVVKVFSAIMSTELVVLQAIRHPHVCARTGIVSVDVAKHIPVGVVMPRYTGDLGTILVEWREAARYLTHACAGLSHLHSAGILHLDLSPGNLFIDLGARKMVVGDFGLSLLLPLGERRVFNMVQRCSYPAPETGPQPCPPGCPILAALPMMTASKPEDNLGFVYTREVDFYGLGHSFYDTVVSRMRGGIAGAAKKEFVEAVRALMDNNPDRRIPPTSPSVEVYGTAEPPLSHSTPPSSGVDILGNLSTPTPTARRLLATLRSFCKCLLDWSPDVPLTILVVLLDTLLRWPTLEERNKKFPAAAYLAMAYTFQQEIDMESVAGVTPNAVAQLLLEIDGLIYEPQTSRITDRSCLRSAVATVLSERPVSAAEPSSNRLPFYNCLLAQHMRPRRHTNHIERSRGSI